MFIHAPTTPKGRGRKPVKPVKKPYLREDNDGAEWFDGVSY